MKSTVQHDILQVVSTKMVSNQDSLLIETAIQLEVNNIVLPVKL
jgi:hypothetical protein